MSNWTDCAPALDPAVRWEDACNIDVTNGGRPVPAIPITMHKDILPALDAVEGIVMPIMSDVAQGFWRGWERNDDGWAASHAER